MKLAARCRFVTTIALLALIAPQLSAEPSETDSGLAWVPIPSAGVAAPYVSAIAQGNNQIYVGGNFDTIAPITGSVALLDNAAVADGTNDGDEVIMEFPRLRGGVTAIYAVASDGNDGWYIGGDFSVTFGGLTFTNAMHVLAGGSVNGDWRPNPNGIVRAIEVDTANDVVYLGGEFTSLSNNVGAAPWFDTDWPYRIAVTIDQTKVSVDETEFPLLISITDPALRDMANGGHVAQSDGGDILFIKDDATQAAHEIESYDETTGTLVAWVEMPVSTTVTRTIHLYYGNTVDAGNQWDVSGTWDGASADYEAVWHMDDGGTTNVPDSTSNGLDGTSNASLDAAGFIGQGQVFDGAADEITVGDDAAIQSQAPFTVSAWVKRSAIGEDDFILYKHGTGGDDGWGLKIEATNEITFTHFADHAGSPPQTVGGIYDAAWHHIAVTESATSGGNSTFVIYLDGQPVLSVTAASGAGNDDGDLVFGAETDATGAIITYSDLTMDEVRIASSAHSANWLATCYANQYSPSEFYSAGSEETNADRAYLAAVDALSGSVLPFNPAPDDTVHAIKLTGSLLLVGGEFGEILGDSDVDGCAGIDTTTETFYAGAGWVPESLSLTAGGNCYAINVTTVLGATYILLGGDFTEVNTTSSPNFARVRVSTGLVLATAAQPNGTVYAIGITGGTSNRAVIGGTFTAIAGGAAGTGDNCRWLGAVVASSGAVVDYDTQLSDSSGQNIGVRAITAVSGTVYVGGVFDTFIEDVDGAAVTTNPINLVALTGNPLPPLNEDTNLNTLSGGTAILDTTVYALAVDAAGTVCVGGSFMGVSQMTRNNAYALDDDDDTTPATTYDYRQVTAWNPNVTSMGVAAGVRINDIFIDSTGNAYITGLFDAVGATMKNSLSKTDGTTGAADAGFPSFDAATKEGEALAGDGTNLYVGGTFTDIGGMGGPRLAEITYAGVVNAAFPSAAVRVKALHIYNTILYVGLAGGSATALGGSDRAGAGAIDLTTDTVMPWDPKLEYVNWTLTEVDAEVYMFSSDASGVYAVGQIDYANNQAHTTHGVVLIEHATGGAAGNATTSFSTDNEIDWWFGNGYPSEMNSVVVQNGALYCTGYIVDLVTGTNRAMVKLDAASGAIDPGYATSVWADQQYYGDPPIPMLFESSQGLIAGGYFTGSVGSDDAHYLGEFYYSSLTVADRSGGAIGNGESPSMNGIDTDFGDLDTNKRSQPLTITLSNAGGGTIDISAITLIGTDPTEFELDTSDTDMALTGSESTTFDVYFIPATGGNKSATVQIDHNDDIGAQPFTFDVEGTALTATMTVYETDASGLVITDGSIAPGEPTERDFGIVGVDAGISDPFVVYIENTGDGTLTLGIPSLGGNDPGEFLIGLGGFSTTVLAGATTQFSVYFNPTAKAYMRAIVSFACNDPAVASPFTFEVVGFGDEPALIVAVDGAAIADGDPAPQFPDEFVGEISVDVMTVEVRNSGLSTLTVGIPFLDGVNPDQFSLDTTGYTTPLDFSENTQFTVTFAPTSAGAKTAEIHITHDDPTDGDGVFIFQILGDGISPSALSITTETELTATYPGAAYSTTLAASGGIPSYTWTKIGGVLPPGLSLSTSGQITGTVGDSAKGQYIFAAQVEDTLGDTVNRPFSINVVAAPLNITGIAPSGVGGCALDNDQSPGTTWPLAGIMLAIIATAHTIRRRRTANLR